MLYDHYHVSVYRFLYYRVGSVPLAEDLTSETFFRALRSMSSFRWQGKDFGAWLMTIARNLTTDHFKAGRTRLEHDHRGHGRPRRRHRGPRERGARRAHQRGAARGAHASCPTSSGLPDHAVPAGPVASPRPPRSSAAATGAVKQLQLRGVRNLAKLMPEGMR